MDVTTITAKDKKQFSTDVKNLRVVMLGTSSQVKNLVLKLRK